MVQERDPNGPEPWPGFDAGLPAPPLPAPPPRADAPPPVSRSRPGGLLVALVGALVAALMLVTLGSAVWRASGRLEDVRTRHEPSAALAGGAANAVVTIETSRRMLVDDPAEGTQIRVHPLGAGTGMILTPSGQVLTNNHVVREASSIRVSIPGRSGSYSATVLGVDPGDDVALLQLQGVSGLPTITLGDSSAVGVGDPVVVIGNALGAGTATSTSGTISGLHRTITASDPGGPSTQLDDMIQTNATIRPGDSGGPLVNADGEVVGMITAGSMDGFHDFSSNVGFAIPSDEALSVVRQIRAGDESSGVLLGERGFLGISADRLSPTRAAALGVSSGVLVVDVWPDSPAERAGITPSSVITAVDGQAVDSMEGLGTALHSHEPGEQVSVTWVDASGVHTATVALMGGPAV